MIQEADQSEQLRVNILYTTGVTIGVMAMLKKGFGDFLLVDWENVLIS